MHTGDSSADSHVIGDRVSHRQEVAVAELMGTDPEPFQSLYLQHQHACVLSAEHHLNTCRENRPARRGEGAAVFLAGWLGTGVPDTIHHAY